MDIESFRDYCLSKPAVTEECPFGPDTLVFKVAGKVFALAGLDTIDLSVNLKCNPLYAEELRERHTAVVPGYHMNKKHWNTVNVSELNDIKLFKSLVDHSYDLVVKSLPLKVQKSILE